MRSVFHFDGVFSTVIGFCIINGNYSIIHIIIVQVLGRMVCRGTCLPLRNLDLGNLYSTRTGTGGCAIYYLCRASGTCIRRRGTPWKEQCLYDAVLLEQAELAGSH